MSSYVDKEYFYYLRGRELLLYKLLGSRNRTRITQTGILQSYHNELMYPDEDIANGLRIEYTSLDAPFIAEALEDMQVFYSASTITFNDNSSSSDTITDSANGFGDFGTTDKIRIIGSASNDGDYQLTNSAAGTLTVATGSFTAESAGESVTIYQIPKAVTTSSADETSHMNLNRMLSLACVDYLKAMLADRDGDIERKEYYMREFWGKVGDNESNKRKISMSLPASPYAMR